MIPFNVITTENLGIPYLERDNSHHTFRLLSKANCVQLKATNEISINRAILNLITVPNLRAAHIFQFKKKAAWWSVYDNKYNPLTEHEIRGTMVLAMQQVRHNSTSSLSPITIHSNSFVKSTEKIIKHLQSFSVDEKVFIVLVFKEHILVTGNYYDETTLCRALLNFSPRKSKRVIRKMTSDVQSEHPFLFVQERYLMDKKKREEWLLIS